MQYFGFGKKLFHELPSWVMPDSSVFHIRIRCAANNPVSLTAPALATTLLESVQFYHSTQIWHPAIFLLMPDHLHALLSFTPKKTMSRVIADWKRYHAAKNGVRWQDGYFDHRLRNEEQFELKYQYILNNPVVKNLCAKPEEWPWWIGHSMRDGSPTRKE